MKRMLDASRASLKSPASLASNQAADGVWARDRFGVVVDVELGLDT